MRIINKTITSIFLLLATSISLAMEKQQSNQRKSNPIEIRNGEQSSYSSYLSSSLAYAVSSFDSATNTIMNIVSDDAAFKKLGWPPNDSIAQQELEKSKSIYDRHNKSFKNYGTYPEYQEDCDAINRRTNYCQRVLVALYNDTILNRVERGKLALHCLQHHGQALNEFDKSKFVYFVTEEQKKIKNDTQNIDQEFQNLTLVSKDNELLNNLLKQSIKKEEQRKNKK